jgi:hypothetical protein
MAFVATPRTVTKQASANDCDFVRYPIRWTKAKRSGKKLNSDVGRWVLYLSCLFTTLLSATRFLIDRSPRAGFGGFSAYAFFLVTFLNMVGLTFLLICIAALITLWHILFALGGSYLAARLRVVVQRVPRFLNFGVMSDSVRKNIFIARHSTSEGLDVVSEELPLAVPGS